MTNASIVSARKVSENRILASLSANGQAIPSVASGGSNMIRGPECPQTGGLGTLPGYGRTLSGAPRQENIRDRVKVGGRGGFDRAV